MNIFDIDQDVEVQEASDFSGKRTLDTGVYTGKVKMAYMDTSKGGANSLNLEFDFGGLFLKVTEYITSGKEKGCKNFYIDKKTGKKKLLPGMQNMNELANVIAGGNLGTLEMDDKVIKIWDFDLKKEAPVKRKVITGLLGKAVKIAVQEIQENKYADPTQAVLKNEIAKVVFVDTDQTMAEKNAGKDAAWLGKWLEKNEGLLRDNFVKPEGEDIDVDDTLGMLDDDEDDLFKDD